MTDLRAGTERPAKLVRISARAGNRCLPRYAGVGKRSSAGIVHHLNVCDGVTVVGLL